MLNKKINKKEKIKVNNIECYTDKSEIKIKFSEEFHSIFEYIPNYNSLKIILYLDINQEFKMIYNLLNFKKFTIELEPGLFFICGYHSYEVDKLKDYSGYSAFIINFEIEKIKKANSYNDITIGKGKRIFKRISTYDNKAEGYNVKISS